MKASGADTCTCGHLRTAHEHYRRGTDCSLCPVGVCRRFRRTGSLVGDLFGWARRTR